MEPDTEQIRGLIDLPGLRLHKQQVQGGNGQAAGIYQPLKERCFDHLGKPQKNKKKKNLSDPPPLGLVAIGTFSLHKTLHKQVLISLVAHPFCPHPLLVAGPLREELFLRLPLVRRAFSHFTIIS